MTRFALIEDFGTIQLYGRVEEPSPKERAAREAALAADNARVVRELKAIRRAGRLEGVTEDYRRRAWHVMLEAFGPTLDACLAAEARYLKTFPEQHWRTRFEKVRAGDGEFTAHGYRNLIEDWY